MYLLLHLLTAGGNSEPFLLVNYSQLFYSYFIDVGYYFFLFGSWVFVEVVFKESTFCVLYQTVVRYDIILESA